MRSINRAVLTVLVPDVSDDPAKVLHQIQKSVKSGAISRRLGMLIVFLNTGGMFKAAASIYECDRRTVSLWWNRLPEESDMQKIRNALSDKPRTGRPPKIRDELLDKAKLWCKDRAFTIPELSDYLYKISNVQLSLCQTRRYAKRWGKSTKKTSPIHINADSLESVKSWRRSIWQKISYYTRRNYTLVSMDESHLRRRAVC